MVRRSRKLVVMVVVLTLVLSLWAPVTLADGNGKNMPPGQLKKMANGVFLKDISGHWAEEYISRMNCKKVIAGYDDRTFKPEKPVTRLEALVLALRIAGLEDQTKGLTNLPSSFKHNKQVGAWAVGYIVLGIQKGILTADDIWNFRANQPAKRYEVAVFVIRALGLTKEAEAKAGASLSFKDADSIPGWARGYVALAVEKQLLSGNPDGMFQPMKPMKRAEIAVILAKVDGIEDNELDERQVEGTIKAVTTGTTPSITVTKESNTEVVVSLEPNGLIFREHHRVGLDKLVVGDEVEILLNEAGKGILVEASKSSAQEPTKTEYEGVIKALSGSVITLTTEDNKEVAFAVYADTTIKLDDKSAGFTDLEVGQKVEAEVIDGKLVKIEATTPEQDSEVEGQIVALTAGPPSVVALVTNQVVTSYTLLTNARIVIDDQIKAFTDLKIGDAAELTLQDGKVLLVEVDRD